MELAALTADLKTDLPRSTEKGAAVSEQPTDNKEKFSEILSNNFDQGEEADLDSSHQAPAWGTTIDLSETQAIPTLPPAWQQLTVNTKVLNGTPSLTGTNLAAGLSSELSSNELQQAIQENLNKLSPELAAKFQQLSREATEQGGEIDEADILQLRDQLAQIKSSDSLPLALNKDIKLETLNIDKFYQFIKELPAVNSAVAHSSHVMPINKTVNIIDGDMELLSTTESKGSNQFSAIASTSAYAHAGQAQSSIPPIKVPFEVDSAAWRQALSDRIVFMSNQQFNSAEIQLNPPDLGPLEVTLKMQQNNVQLAFTSQNALVRDAIEDSLPKLREMLDSTGVNLMDTNVSDQSSSLAQQKHGQENPQGSAQAGNEAELKEGTTSVVVKNKIGLVDDFA